jgi:hypothetical protein
MRERDSHPNPKGGSELVATYAPQALKDLMIYWKGKGGVNLGVVGDTAHAQRGVSYHLGKSQLLPGAYSIRTDRDKKGLTEAASAIDLGKLKDSFTELQKFSLWFANQCKAGKTGYNDVREVIWWDPVGQRVLGWSDLSPVKFIPGYGDNSHKTHTHISFYRDSENRDKIAMFKPYFEKVSTPHYEAIVTQPTPLWNDVPAPGRWVYNGKNNIKVGTKLEIRGAQKDKGGQRCWPIVAGTPYGPRYVPVAHVKLGAKI